MRKQNYETPLAFKQALETHLRARGKNIVRERQILIFDRFLARVSVVMGEAIILKGGFALELRLHRARTTNDIDFRAIGNPKEILSKLQQAGQLQIPDFLSFEIEVDSKNPSIKTEGMIYEGKRFRAEAKLAGKLFGQPFGIDVAFAEKLVSKPKKITCADTLAFAGIAPPSILVYPIEAHIAEKLHAYTLPRKQINSRIKDLPDLGLLSQIQDLDSKELMKAIKHTFKSRNTHDIPTKLPEPPSSWVKPYQRMAKEDELPWENIADLFQSVKNFIDPVLDKTLVIRWSHTKLRWKFKH